MKKHMIKGMSMILTALLVIQVPYSARAATAAEQEAMEYRKLNESRKAVQKQNEENEEDIKKIIEDYEFGRSLEEKYKKQNKAGNGEVEGCVLTQEEAEEYSDFESYNEELRDEEERILKERSASRPDQSVDYEEVKKATKRNLPYQKVLLKGEDSLSANKKRKIERIKKKVLDDAVGVADEINQLDDEFFYIATKEALDEYYENVENVDERKISEFAETIDEKADELLQGYEAALKERQNADILDYETEQIIVVFKEGTPYEDIQGITECLGGEIDIIDGGNKELADYMAEENNSAEKRIYAKINIGIGQTVEMAKRDLEQIDCIEAVDYNAYIPVDSVSVNLANDPGKSNQTYLNQINVDGAWNALANALGYCDYEKNKSVIVIIDTGFDVTHSELKNVLSKRSITTSEKDANGNFKSLFNCSTPYYSDHGSHVAGIIAAQSNNSVGMVGITNVYDKGYNKYLNACEIIGINAGSGGGIGIQNQIDGIQYAISCGADVINMSYGSATERPARDLALSEAHEAGIVLVAAAGNESTNTAHYPSNLKNVISVAWLNQDGTTRNSGSNYGNGIDIAAPGTSIYSCSTGSSSMVRKSGTSMATPMVTAAVGFMRAVNPNLTPEEIENILYTTATDLYTSGWDANSGYGRVNIGKAVLKAKQKSFANTYKQEAYSAQCWWNKGTYMSFAINPMVDVYDIYRSENPGTLGKKVGRLGRTDLMSSDSRVLYTAWDLEAGKTYYYSAVGWILDGNTEVDGAFVIGPASQSQIKIDCTYLTGIKIWPSYYYTNNIFMSYDGKFDYFLVRRSEDSTMPISNYDVLSTKTLWLPDTTGVKGKTYYYESFAVYRADSVTYYSDTSNRVSMKIQ
ncbi:MAG: S8 family serine peptidase [Eubacterium sp.]|nr:S8 family serine peptidase [Eubacterium sp.]